jgi:hypothetical protein
VGFFSRNKPKGPTHSEKPLSADTAKMIAGSANDALKMLGLDDSAPPGVVIEALDAFVDAVQHGERTLPEGVEAEDLPYSCGSLWGQQLVRQFNWEWATVTFHQHKDTQAPGVLSPDRKLAIYPIHFLIGCFRDRGVDCTMALSFNMLMAGKMSDLDVSDRSYANLMDRVGRIVPRR